MWERASILFGDGLIDDGRRLLCSNCLCGMDFAIGAAADSGLSSSCAKSLPESAKPPVRR
jgi:hypothetical protein